MKKLTILVIALFVISMAAPVFAGPFSDVKPGCWAYQAVKTLAARGILEGYPSNRFDGNKPMTRYEVAQMVARLIDKGVVKGGDYSTLQKLTIEFADELALLGVKVTALEDEVKAIRTDQEDMKAKLDHMGMGKIKVTADARYRFESTKNDNALSRNANSLRFRFNMSTLIDENVSAYFSFQDETLLNSAVQNNVSTNVNGAGLNRNLFLGYVDIKNFGTVVDNFRFGRQTLTIGKGLLFDDEVDGMLVRKDYRGTIFQFGAYDTRSSVTTPANDGLDSKLVMIDHAWDKIAAGAYYLTNYDSRVTTKAYGTMAVGTTVEDQNQIFGLTLDAKLGRDVVAYVEYASEDSDAWIDGAMGRSQEGDAYKVGVEWTINKYYDLSVLYQEREKDFTVIAHNDDYSDSAFYGNAPLYAGANGISTTASNNYNNSQIMSVIFGAKLRDDLQLDLWYEDFQAKDEVANISGNYDQDVTQAIVTYQYRDNTSFKLRYRTVDFDEGDGDYKAATTTTKPSDYDEVRFDMNVKF